MNIGVQLEKSTGIIYLLRNLDGSRPVGEAFLDLAAYEVVYGGGCLGAVEVAFHAPIVVIKGLPQVKIMNPKLPSI